MANWIGIVQVHIHDTSSNRGLAFVWSQSVLELEGEQERICGALAAFRTPKSLLMYLNDQLLLMHFTPSAVCFKHQKDSALALKPPIAAIQLHQQSVLSTLHTGHRLEHRHASMSLVY